MTVSKSEYFEELLDGLSVNQLAKLFGLDRRTVSNRLQQAGAQASSTARRQGYKLYKVCDVAEILIEPYATPANLRDQVTVLKHSGNHKDYWDAMLKRQKFLLENKDLWRTERVIEVFSEVFKQFRETCVVFSDNIEHESDLPPEIIDKTKKFIDALLIEIREKLLVMDLDPSLEKDNPGEPDDKGNQAETECDLSDLGLD